MLHFPKYHHSDYPPYVPPAAFERCLYRTGDLFDTFLYNRIAKSIFLVLPLTFGMQAWSVGSSTDSCNGNDDYANQNELLQTQRHHYLDFGKLSCLIRGAIRRVEFFTP